MHESNRIFVQFISFLCQDSYHSRFAYVILCKQISLRSSKRSKIVYNFPGSGTRPLPIYFLDKFVWRLFQLRNQIFHRPYTNVDFFYALSQPSHLSLLCYLDKLCDGESMHPFFGTALRLSRHRRTFPGFRKRPTGYDQALCDFSISTISSNISYYTSYNIVSFPIGCESHYCIDTLLPFHQWIGCSADWAAGSQRLLFPGNHGRKTVAGLRYTSSDAVDRFFATILHTHAVSC